MRTGSPETIVVGAGIVGLTVAERLTRAGQTVAVIDGKPSPFARVPRNMLGTTYSGMDARHVSTTEHVSKARPFSARNFMLSTEAGGFLPKPFEHLSQREQYWIKTLAELTDNLEFIDFVDLYICEANYIGLRGWRQWMNDDPDLFRNVGLQNGVPIFYTEPRELEAAFKFESNWDSVRKVDLAEVRDRFPAIARHFEDGFLIGGLETDSFAFGIHKMARNIRTRLKGEGVDFRWNRPITGIKQDDNGEVEGLYTGEKLLEAENYVFCTGIFGSNVLSKVRTLIPNILMGVAGFWVEMPKQKGLDGAFKLSTAHLNVTPYDGGTRASGGFVFVGEDDIDLTNPGVNAGFRNFQGVVSQIFPEATITRIQACIRPMSLTGWEWWDKIPTSNGGNLIVSTGQGAGGTTQAPFIAERVFQNLTGLPSELIFNNIHLPPTDLSRLLASIAKNWDEGLYPPEVSAELNRIGSSWEMPWLNI